MHLRLDELVSECPTCGTYSNLECKCDIDVPPCSLLARTGYTKGCCLVDTRRDEFEDTRRDEFEDCELPYAVELFALMYW